MKKETILKCILFLSTVFLLQSCEESTDHSMIDNDWQFTTIIAVNPVEDKETFIWERDVFTLEEYWRNEVIELNLKLKSQLTGDDFSKVDFYIVAEEKDGYNYTAPFNTSGKMVGSVNSIPETGEFSLSLAAEDVYGLFSSDFKKDRSTRLVQDGDIFLLYWVITAKDGSILDSRQSIRDGNRFKINALFQDFSPPVWEGAFNYEIIDIGVPFAQSIGSTGQITIIDLGGGRYTVNSLTFDYEFTGSGTLVYDFLTGKTFIDPGDDYEDVVWNISNINGTSLDIRWTYKYTADFDEWSTVRLTRTDGVDWPTNINSN